MTDSRQDQRTWRFALQDGQYRFPYHYLPHFDQATGAGVRARSLGWGLEYLCYLQHVAELTRSLRPRSVLDVGCGEGRFLDLLGPQVERRVGIDPSAAAIRFARAFCPELELHTEPSSLAGQSFDVISSIEVLEHVPEDEVGAFIRQLCDWTHRDGRLILVVPTTAARLLAKHYRHYDLPLFERQISEAGAPLEIEQVEYLVPSRPRWQTFLSQKLLHNRWWQLDVFALRGWVWRQVWEQRRVDSSAEGRHLVALLRKTR